MDFVIYYTYIIHISEPEACVIDSWAQGYVETVPNEPEE